MTGDRKRMADHDLMRDGELGIGGTFGRGHWELPVSAVMMSTETGEANG